MEQNANNSIKQKIRKEILEWIEVIIIAIIISLPIRYFIAETFIVNGASMDPTFATNQFLIVDRLTYRFEEPNRGDVIVFEYPNDPSTYYIKRIIGLPGETVEMIDGVVSIKNDSSSTTKTILDESYVSENHRSHDTLKHTLGKTEYFVMGDNRLESYDSRYWGPVKKDLIIGRPILRLYPLQKISLFPGEIKN